MDKAIRRPEFARLIAACTYGNIRFMNKDVIIAKLHNHRAELTRLGVDSLALFGSIARGDAGRHADIDLAVVYNDATVRDLIDMGGIAAAIEEALGTGHFDLANERQLRPHIRENFLKEHVRIF